MKNGHPTEVVRNSHVFSNGAFGNVECGSPLSHAFSVSRSISESQGGLRTPLPGRSFSHRREITRAVTRVDRRCPRGLTGCRGCRWRRRSVRRKSPKSLWAYGRRL